MIRSTVDSNTDRLSRLSHSDLTDLLRYALQKHPDLESAVSDSLARADARILAKSLEPPPPVDYDYLQSEFYDELHSCDDLRESQKFLRAYKIAQNLHPFITQAVKSVNENSPIEVVRDAIACLLQFAQDMSKASGGKIHQRLTGDYKSPMEAVCDGLLTIGALARRKAFRLDDDAILEIESYAKRYRWLKFDEVESLLCEGSEDSGEDEDGSEDEDSDGEEYDECEDLEDDRRDEEKSDENEEQFHPPKRTRR